jgi:hypothetical protein
LFLFLPERSCWSSLYCHTKPVLCAMRAVLASHSPSGLQAASFVSVC